MNTEESLLLKGRIFYPYSVENALEALNEDDRTQRCFSMLASGEDMLCAELMREILTSYWLKEAQETIERERNYEFDYDTETTPSIPVIHSGVFTLWPAQRSYIEGDDIGATDLLNAP